MSNVSELGYAGDVSPGEAWEALSQNGKAVLVDVRTKAEWSFVGTPALASLGREPVLREWQIYPGMAVDTGFVAGLVADLGAAGLDQDTPLYFLCRSGARSRSAALAMTAAGWTRAYNVSDGFEGPLDTDGHRGRRAGWKASGLPWIQT